MKRNWSVHGVVLHNGLPVPQRVLHYVVLSSAKVHECVTDNDGRFLLGQLPTPNILIVPLFSGYHADKQFVDARVQTFSVVRLQKGATVRVTATSLSGIGRSELHLKEVYTGEGGYSPVENHTRCVAQWSDLALGKYELSLSNEWFNIANPQPLVITKPKKVTVHLEVVRSATKRQVCFMIPGSWSNL
jgi:hypothetical protein